VADVKPPIPVGHCKAAVHGFLGPAEWVNVFYFVVTAGSRTPGQVIGDVVTACHNFYANVLLLAGMPSTWRTTFTTVTYRDSSTSTVRLRIADAQTGTGGTDAQDAQVAYLFNWGTGDPRKGGKPRQYVAGVLNAQMADSAFLNSARQAAVNANIITWLTSLPGMATPMQLVEMSFRNDKTWRDNAATYPIIGGVLNPVVATQRRRVDRLRPS
jgi:hypothetical protein